MRYGKMTKPEYMLFALTDGWRYQDVTGETGYEPAQCQQIWQEIERVRALYEEAGRKSDFKDYL